MTKYFDKRHAGDAAYMALTSAGVRELRRAAGADEVTKTALAGQIGMSRQTLAGRFKTGDMKLSEFTAAALALNRKPSELLAAAESTIPALAENEVE